MKNPLPKIHIGLRTIKTALAVLLSLVLVEFLGTTDSKLIFAMLGAMAAVQPTFRESLEACLSQIIGVIFGGVCSVVLLAFPMPPLVAVGIGIVLVITLYNILQIRYSPSLSCFILVLSATTADIQPISYATGRVWDTAIGLAIGMAVNMLIFPYDNSRQIRATAYSLDKTLIRFLEELFDGDDILPDVGHMSREITTLEQQLKIFSSQKLLLNLRRQSRDLEAFQTCEEKARSLITHMEVLCAMPTPGCLNALNRQRLLECGANIQDLRPLDTISEPNIVTNYHVSRILTLRQELLDVLEA